ncbi:hypothetical protein NOK12_39510 [Nocardioides sp. OK12]|nr:hypothetical protein NOK12_39510 [Nocardioides sp. OK12]
MYMKILFVIINYKNENIYAFYDIYVIFEKCKDEMLREMFAHMYAYTICLN